MAPKPEEKETAENDIFRYVNYLKKLTKRRAFVAILIGGFILFKSDLVAFYLANRDKNGSNPVSGPDLINHREENLSLIGGWKWSNGPYITIKPNGHAFNGAIPATLRWPISGGFRMKLGRYLAKESHDVQTDYDDPD